MHLKSDELLSDIDAAIDLHSGEAQDWEHKFHVVDWGSVWTHGAFGLDHCVDMAVLTDLCFYSGLQVGSKFDLFDWLQVVAWFPRGADGERATSSGPRPRSAHNDVLATNLWLADIFSASRPPI